MTGLFFTSYVVLWVVVGAQLLAIMALYHHFGEMYLGKTREGRASQGPEVSSKLRRVETQDLAGNAIVLSESSRPSFMMFASTGCKICTSLKPELSRFAETNRDNIETIVICAGDRNAVRAWAVDLGPNVRVIPDMGNHIADQYDVSIIPICVGVDAAGEVRSTILVNDRRGMEAVLKQILRDRLDTSEGQLVELTDLKGAL